MQIGSHRRRERGITLVEMVVVIAIAVIMMRLLLPAFKGLGGNKQSFAATTQFIGDLNNARLMAMNNGAPVYVVFMPLAKYMTPNQQDYFKLADGGNPLLGKQLVSYAFFAEYVLGDSLGNPSNRWLSDWKQLSEGAFFPSRMLADLRQKNIQYAADNDLPPFTIPHIRNGGPSGVNMQLPYIGFDARGRLIGVSSTGGEGAIIRLVEGGVLPPEKDASTGKYLVQPADEPLNIDRVENYVLINYQTGRARTTVVKAVPAGKKLVKIRIIKFTDRLWRSPTFGGFLYKQMELVPGEYMDGWQGAYKLVEGEWRLKVDTPAPVAIKDMPARLAAKLQAMLLERDPDAELLIE